MEKKYFILVCCFVLPLIMEAQSVQADSIHYINGVTVTGTRKQASILAVPHAVSVLRRKEMDDFQFRTLPEALQGQTGIFIQKTNHGGGSPFIRGLTGNQTLVLVDGIRFNNATFRFGPNQYLNTLDAYTVSKIEIARGTGSVQYGSDAMGGVIQVFTKDPVLGKEKRFGFSGMGKAATQGMEYTGRAGLTFESEKLGFVGGYTNRRFGDLYGGDTTGKQNPSGYTEQSFDAKLKWAPVKDLVLTVAHQYLEQKDVPLYHRVKLENFTYYFFSPQRRLLSYAKMELDGKHKLADKISLIASLQKTLENRNYLRNGNANRFIEEDKVRTTGLTAEISSIITPDWTANSGIEFYQDRVKSFKQQIPVNGNSIQTQRGLYPNNATASNFSLYTLHHITYKRWDLELGLRYNGFVVTIPDTSSHPQLKLGEIKAKPRSLVTNAAILYHLSGSQSMYTSFSTGYRAPNIDDMGTLGLVDFRYEIPAYGLSPEKSYHTEIGYRLNHRSVQASVSFFYMHLQDLITRVQLAGQNIGGYQVYAKENSQVSFIRGVEGTLNYMPGTSFRATAGASYTYGQNLSRNEPMRRIPPFNARLALHWSLKQCYVSVEQMMAGKQNRLASGDQNDNRIPAGGTPGWYVVNFYGGYTTQLFSIRTGIQNISNTDYRTHGSGINGVGRSGWLSLQINL